MAVNFHISKDGNLVTIRHIKDSFELPTPEAGKTVQVPRYQQDFNTNSFPLTASNPSGSNIKIVRSDGLVVINSVPYTSLKTGTNNANIGATAAATVSALNGANFFGAGSIDDDVATNTAAHTANDSNITSLQNTVTSEQAKTLALENAVKTATGDRGVYVTNSKDETSSKVKLTATTAKLQAGAKTGVEADESSPGTLTFTVASGASGSEVETTALTISGNTQGKTLVDFITSGLTIKSNSSTAAGTLSLFEGSSNGTHKLNLRAPAALTAETVLVFPDGTGSNGQVLSTDGAGILSWVDQSGSGSVSVHGGASDILRVVSDQIGASTNLISTIAADRLVFYDHSATKLTALELGTNLAISGTTLNASFTDTNTNIANTDLSLDANRSVNMNNNYLTFKDGTSTKLQYDPNSDKFTFSSGLRVSGDFEVNATSGMSSGQVKFREPAMGGSSGVILQAPSTNMSADVTFTLPETDGSAGQFLKTDGSGNLSFASASGSGGGDGNHYLGQFGGLFTYASTDSGERVGLNTTYGAYFYSHSTEPDQTALRNYDASQAIDSATSTMDNYKIMMQGFRVHTTNKKVKCIYSFRIQNAPSGSTWGMSLWGGTLNTSGAINSERTVTLRGKTSDITVSSTLSTVVYHGEFTTTSNINAGSIVPFLENRTGTLTTTTRVYGSFKLYLVD